MKERLLQFIWQENFFQLTDLQVETGEQLLIQHPGEWNKDQGPDFLNARIRLDSTYWAGHVEIHIKSSQWYQHRHQRDPAYQNVVLHVVWENDDKNLSQHLPTLVLQDKVSKLLLDRYADLMSRKDQLVCEQWIGEVSENTWLAWKKDLMQQRLQRKAATLLEHYKSSNKNWEAACWWAMARGMGAVVNGSFFEQVAQSIPTRLLARHKDQVIQLEAVLLGQANLLNHSSADPYVQLLQREYEFIRSKFKLPLVHGQALKLRMRPAGFPEVRLAQLAMLIHRQGTFSRHWLETEQLAPLMETLSVTANDFWHYHYTLKEASPFQPKHIGSSLVQQLVINVIIPFVYACGIQQEKSIWIQKAVSWLEQLEPEKNNILKQWSRVGIPCRNGMESQALIELTNYYCQEKRCLDCMVGRTLLAPKG